MGGTKMDFCRGREGERERERKKERQEFYV
jgi:hypothetical protein